MLWQLFVATSNHFSRTLDRDRLHAPDEVPMLERVKALAGEATLEEIERFWKDSRGGIWPCIRRRRSRRILRFMRS